MPTTDARGLACPQPVILTRRAMQGGQPCVTVVDNDIAVGNVSRMARAAGWDVSVDQRADGTYLTLMPPSGTAVEATQPAAATAVAGPTVVLLAADTLGRGDDTLGSVLMRAFLHTLGEMAPPPDYLICMNAGVKLAAAGSPVLDDLRALVEAGTELLVCGTCVDFFGLKDSLATGTISNMYTIAELLLGAGRIVRP